MAWYVHEWVRPHVGVVPDVIHPCPVSSWFSRPVHGHLDGMGIGGVLDWVRQNTDGDSEHLPTARSAHESQVVEPGNLVLEARRGIAQFGGAVFVVSSC